MLDANVQGCHVVHFNHQFRGEASDADAAFVEVTAKRLGVPVTIISANVSELAQGQNWEATARDFRYEHLQRLGKELNLSWAATGHTADDQAETVLHHLIRGSGMSGLRGVAPIRYLGDSTMSLIRPMLNITRKEVEAYLAELGQDYRTDATNADPRFTRNRIRHELLPMLRTFNVNVDAALTRSADHFCEIDDYLSQQTQDLFHRAVRPPMGRYKILDVTALSLGAPLIRRELYRLVWRSMLWPIGAMTRQHWLRVDDVAMGTLTACDFPEGVHVRRVRDVVRFWRDS